METGPALHCLLEGLFSNPSPHDLDTNECGSGRVGPQPPEPHTRGPGNLQVSLAFPVAQQSLTLPFDHVRRQGGAGRKARVPCGKPALRAGCSVLTSSGAGVVALNPRAPQGSPSLPSRSPKCHLLEKPSSANDPTSSPQFTSYVLTCLPWVSLSLSLLVLFSTGSGAQCSG